MAIEQGNDTTPDDNKMHVTSVLAQQHEHAILDQDATSDEQTLGALGYKQEFKRYDHGYELVPLSSHSAILQPQNIQPHFSLYSDVPSVCIPLGEHTLADVFVRDFSLFESFSVSFSVLGLLPSIASTLGYSLGYSGTGGAVWGWLIASLFIQCTAFSMAELCSSMPTAGGLYYAAAVLAPEGWGLLASWFVGWSNFCGFVTGPCSVNYALGELLAARTLLDDPTF